ncbi:MAG: dienelactone hydrolase family protein [Caldimonas sp.]
MSKFCRALAAALLACGPMVAAWAQADSEVARTFEQGWAHFRLDGSLQVVRIAQALPQLSRLPRSTFRGTVVYMHGCSGIDALSDKTADMLAAAGYLVFIPDSFARMSKPVSCDPSRNLGGLHREVLSWRQAEAGHALEQVKALPSVDASKVFLMGLSEGGIATATYVGEAVAGRIIEGWTCHAGWLEYRGLLAPTGEPVLAMSSENDPWFQEPVLRGDCGEFMTTNSALRRSVVFRSPHPAAPHHDLMWNADARRLVFEFLDAASGARP